MRVWIGCSRKTNGLGHVITLPFLTTCLLLLLGVVSLGRRLIRGRVIVDRSVRRWSACFVLLLALTFLSLHLSNGGINWRVEIRVSHSILDSNHPIEDLVKGGTLTFREVPRVAIHSCISVAFQSAHLGQGAV